MRLLRLVPPKTAISFLGSKRLRVFFAISALIVLGSAALVGVRGLNFGIDFAGGILIEVREPGGQEADITALRQQMGALDLGEVSIQRFGEPSDALIRVQRQPGGDEAQAVALSKVRNALGEDYTIRRTETVGPTVGQELIEAGTWAVLLALGAIMAYIWLRFEWQFGLAAVLALVQDVIATIGVFALMQFEFNLSTIAAVLTIAGYSINDTVVVFDRVRENLRKYKAMPMVELINLSLNDTLSRTVNTSVTTLLALGALYILGGPIIQDFAFAMIFGVVIGTYSSICVASAFLLVMNVRRGTSEEGGAAEAQARP